MFNWIKKTIKKILLLLPTKNIVLFESHPDCTGNTKAVFDEMIRRGYNSKYKMIWLLQTSDSKDHNRLPNVRYYKDGNRIYVAYCRAKLFISENCYFSKTRAHGQYALHIFHGGALKDVRAYYRVPEDIDEIITESPFLLELDAKNNSCRKEILNPLGFPRNDVLLGVKTEIDKLFKGHDFKKMIYWMPTFRQHKTNSSLSHSSISIPIIHDEKTVGQINRKAQEYGVLIVVKPHPAQDISMVKSMQLSNLLFIDDTFLSKQKVSNYELLAGADALLTDYSSVYYDYLLTNRSIGLCWEDYDEYKKREGFIIDTDIIMAGGEKIYTADDLCGFIQRVGKGIDLLYERRTEIRNLIFPPPVEPCTGKVVDRIDEILINL